MIDGKQNVRVRLKNLHLPKAANVLATQIKQEIVSGKYPEGVMLPPEHAMAQQLSLSRPTVREALRLLESQGLISIRPGPRGGPRVERPDIPTITRSLTTLFQYERVTLADLLEARRAIEPACARVAGSRATAEDVTALSHSVENMRAHLDGEHSLFWNENANFHLVLVTAGHSIVLHTLMVALRELIYLFTAGLPISREERAKTLADHVAIAEAITAHDPEAAARAALAHLMNFEKRLQEHYPDFRAVCLGGSSASSNSD